MKKQENKYSGINIEILKLANYNLEELDDFMEQFNMFRNELRQKECMQKYGKIEDTQTLLDELNKVDEYDLETLENIAYRIEMYCRTYTYELKDCILEKVEIIRFNNLEKTSKFNVVLDEIIEQVKSVAQDYGASVIEENELEQ